VRWSVSAGITNYWIFNDDFFLDLKMGDSVLGWGVSIRGLGEI
jgi:hypothetical protein